MADASERPLILFALVAGRHRVGLARVDAIDVRRGGGVELWVLLDDERAAGLGRRFGVCKSRGVLSALVEVRDRLRALGVEGSGGARVLRG